MEPTPAPAPRAAPPSTASPAAPAAPAAPASPATPASTSAPAAAPAAEPGWIVLTLALMMSVQPITTDLYLPALPAIREAFGGSMEVAQSTLSALMLAFGFGQLLAGPMADRFGRRPTGIASLVLYTAGAFASASATTPAMLVACRLGQGLGLSGVIVCGRSIVRDLWVPQQGARVMARSLTGLGIIAMVSPLVGGLIASTWGWRAALAASGVFSAAVLALMVAKVPESLAHPNPDALRLGPMLSTWRTIARHRTFQAWSLLVVCSYGGLFAFLGGSAFIWIGILGYSRTQYGWIMMTASLAYMSATFICRRWLGSIGMVRSVKRGALFTLAGSIGLAIAAWIEPARAPWFLIMAQMVYSFGHGMHQPCGQVGVTSPFPRNAGAASALAGFMMAAAAFLVGLWIGRGINPAGRVVLLTEAAGGGLTFLVAWFLVRRHGIAPARDVQDVPGAPAGGHGR